MFALLSNPRVDPHLEGQTFATFWPFLAIFALYSSNLPIFVSHKNVVGIQELDWREVYENKHWSHNLFLSSRP